MNCLEYPVCPSETPAGTRERAEYSVTPFGFYELFCVLSFFFFLFPQHLEV